jgi:hypothetical protein
VSGGELQITLLLFGTARAAVLLDELLEPCSVGAPQFVDALAVFDEDEGGHGAHSMRSRNLLLVIHVDLQPPHKMSSVRKITHVVGNL